MKKRFVINVKSDGIIYCNATVFDCATNMIILDGDVKE